MTDIRRQRRAPEAGRAHSPRLVARRITFVLVAVLVFGVGGAIATWYAKGYRVWVVHTGSMEPNYMPGDVIIDAPPTGDYHRGQVLTFRHSDLTTDVVSHRVVGITSAGLIHTKGDANASADVWEIRPDQVQGRVIGKVPAVGYLLVFLRQPAGIGAIATVVFAMVLLWRMFFPPTLTESTSEAALEMSEVGSR
jgi:signal peptidase I